MRNLLRAAQKSKESFGERLDEHPWRGDPAAGRRPTVALCASEPLNSCEGSPSTAPKTAAKDRPQRLPKLQRVNGTISGPVHAGLRKWYSWMTVAESVVPVELLLGGLGQRATASSPAARSAARLGLRNGIRPSIRRAHSKRTDAWHQDQCAALGPGELPGVNISTTGTPNPGTRTKAQS